MPQYSEKVMDHFKNPRNVGDMPDADGIGHIGNPVCGDIMELYIKVKDNIIMDIKFKTFGCLPADEEIVLSKGSWGNISQLNAGENVVNGNGQQTLSSKLLTADYSGPLYKITPFVSPFNSFSATKNHPIFCIKREWIKGISASNSKCSWLQIRKKESLLSAKPDYVRADELTKSDYLVFNVNREIKDDPQFSKDVMRLMGYYLSEGHIAAQGSVVAFSFNKNERELIKETETLIKKITNKNPKTRIRNNVAEIYICSRKLVRFLVSHCNKIARNKYLSKEVLLLPFSKQWEMIETYMLGDGDRYRRRSNNSLTYRIITTSRLLAIQMQEMLARGNIFASIRQIFKTNCYIDGRKLKDSIQYLISFKLDRLHEFVRCKKDEYFLVPIKKIEQQQFDGPVYNFQVLSEPHSYLVKGFTVHNCGAAIATSSMVTEMVKGKTIEEALSISNRAVAEALGGLPPVKMHCSVLAEDALKSAIDDYLKKITGKGLPGFKPHEEPPH